MSTLLGVGTYTATEFAGVERNMIQLIYSQVASASGTPAKFRFHNRSNNSTGRKIKFAIYANDHSGSPIAETEEWTAPSTSGQGWVELNFVGTPTALVSGTTYEVAAWFEGSSGTYDTVRLNIAQSGTGVNNGGFAYTSPWPSSPSIPGWSNTPRFAYEVQDAPPASADLSALVKELQNA